MYVPPSLRKKLLSDANNKKSNSSQFNQPQQPQQQQQSYYYNQNRFQNKPYHHHHHNNYHHNQYNQPPQQQPNQPPTEQNEQPQQTQPQQQQQQQEKNPSPKIFDKNLNQQNNIQFLQKQQEENSSLSKKKRFEPYPNPKSNNFHHHNSSSQFNNSGFGNKYHREDEDEDSLFKNQTNTGIKFDTYDNIPVSVVSSNGEKAPKPAETFKDFNFVKPLMDNIARAKYSKPTPIQKYGIPILVKNHDMMACAQTGSGKTAGFLFPLISLLYNNNLQHPDYAPNGSFRYSIKPKGLIIAPTRELSTQIYDEARKFCFKSSVIPCVCYGGSDIKYQISKIMYGCTILVGTPGRLNDLIQRGYISMKECRFLILDEADRMLEMGFKDQIEQIIDGSGMPPTGQRQTMMFSATFPKEIQMMASKYLTDFFFVTVGRVGSTVDTIKQSVEYIEDYDKLKRVYEILKENEDKKNTKGGKLKSLIFVKTKKSADYLERYLNERDIQATSIHGDRSQREREYSLFKFKKGTRNVLVATDVASRGLDIPNVSHVINFDLPENIDDYVHRIGRTGRAGNFGLATSFYNTEKNFQIAKELLNLLQESKQEVPQWLPNEAWKIKKMKQIKKGYNKYNKGYGNNNYGNSYGNNNYGNNNYGSRGMGGGFKKPFFNNRFNSPKSPMDNDNGGSPFGNNNNSGFFKKNNSGPFGNKGGFNSGSGSGRGGFGNKGGFGSSGNFGSGSGRRGFGSSGGFGGNKFS